MSSSLFHVIEHQIPCQHIREYPRATRDNQEDVLWLAIKQYVPISNPKPTPGDVTIIAAHANGFPKELYEPLWDELLKQSKSAGFTIRGIWIADVAHQGQSGILNENTLGNDPSWFDHPRDLLHMINHFRDQMPRPLVGIGHSMGGAHLVQLSLIHPRLLSTLVLIDPVIQKGMSGVEGQFGPAKASTFRRDRWPSREEAAASFKRSKFYQAWDPRVLDLWIKYGLRDIPTALYPSSRRIGSSDAPPLPAAMSTEPTFSSVGSQPHEVTLATTKHQEVFTFARPHYIRPGGSVNRILYPDLDPQFHLRALVYRPECNLIFDHLSGLRPSVLYIYGEMSPLSIPDSRKDRLERTGVGLGGSGGAKEGRVQEFIVKKVGHLIPLEDVATTAAESARWLGSELVRWREEEKVHEASWEGKAGLQRQVLDEKFRQAMSLLPGPVRKSKL